jgi:transposase
MSARQAAARFGVGVSSAIRWVARAKIGERTPRPQGWRRGSSLDAHEAFIVGLKDAPSKPGIKRKREFLRTFCS